MQVASPGTVRMRATLGHRGEKDYALLNAERMVYISFVIITFKVFNFVVVVSVLLMLV